MKKRTLSRQSCSEDKRYLAWYSEFRTTRAWSAALPMPFHKRGSGERRSAKRRSGERGSSPDHRHFALRLLAVPAVSRVSHCNQIHIHPTGDFVPLVIGQVPLDLVVGL